MEVALKLLKENRCCICLAEDSTPNVVVLCCGCAFHFNCISDWLLHQNQKFGVSTPLKCPLCRSYIPKLSTGSFMSTQHLESLGLQCLRLFILTIKLAAKVVFTFLMLLLAILYRERHVRGSPDDSIIWYSQIDLNIYIESALYTISVMIGVEIVYDIHLFVCNQYQPVNRQQY